MMSRRVLAAFLVALGVATGDGAAQAEEVGFTARIGGAYEARVSAPGVLVYLPTGGFERKGDYFLADARGLRPHGITFVLPRDIGPGRHELENPTPFALGSVVSVRVDRDTGGAIVAADRNTSGFLVLDSFPEGATQPNGSEISGSFSFETENAAGERIEAEGSFSFPYR